MTALSTPARVEVLWAACQFKIDSVHLKALARLCNEKIEHLNPRQLVRLVWAVASADIVGEDVLMLTAINMLERTLSQLHQAELIQFAFSVAQYGVPTKVYGDFWGAPDCWVDVGI